MKLNLNMARKTARNKKSSSDTNKVLMVLLIFIAGALFALFLTKVNQQSRTVTSMAAGSTGNGAPKGAHYNLNVIGKKGTDCTDNTGGGKRIFVPLTGSTKILLSEGAYDVLDYCGLDGSASFQLPNPDPTNSGTTRYSVYARALGKPGGTSKTNTCATDPLTGEVWCSIYSYVATRTKGKSTFTNVSKQLLYIYVDLDLDGQLERYPLFDSALQDYYWAYDNNGLKLLQLRFYEVPTTVPSP